MDFHTERGGQKKEIPLSPPFSKGEVKNTERGSCLAPSFLKGGLGRISFS